MHGNPSCHVPTTCKICKTTSLGYSNNFVVTDTQLGDGPISYISRNTPLLVMDLALSSPNNVQMLVICLCDGLQSYIWYTILACVSPFPLSVQPIELSMHPTMSELVPSLHYLLLRMIQISLQFLAPRVATQPSVGSTAYRCVGEALQ
jgi:hypothetical protein